MTNKLTAVGPDGKLYFPPEQRTIEEHALSEFEVGFKEGRTAALDEAIGAIKTIDFEKVSDDGHTLLISKPAAIKILTNLKEKV